MKNIKTFRKVRASILNEKLKSKKPNDTITIDVDMNIDWPVDKYAQEAFKKYKLKVKPNRATDVSFDVTGKKQDIIDYLGSEYYEWDDEDIRDIYPELLEASVDESKFKKGQTVKYIVPGTSDKMKTGKITGFESTRDEDFAIIDGKTISFSHISESVNEGISAGIDKARRALADGKKVFGRHTHPRLSGKEFEILSFSPTGGMAEVMWPDGKKPEDMASFSIDDRKIRIED